MENLQKADDTLKDVQTKYEFILSRDVFFSVI